MHARPLPLVVAFAAAVWAGCTPEGETDIADLEVESFSMIFGSNAMEGTLRPLRARQDPCVILGQDARARVNDVELTLFRGKREECLDGSVDCENGVRCRSPIVDISWYPPIDDATLVLSDNSGSISCRLGDAMAPRTFTRVGADTWTLVRGESITVRVSPASDLSRFVPSVEMWPSNRQLTYTTSGDTITFEIPSDLATGPQSLWFELDGAAVPNCDVQARAHHEYIREQRITVQ